MGNETATSNIGAKLTLEQAQDVVEEYAPNDYFRDTYRAWESRYLPHVCDVLEGIEACDVLDIGPGWGTMAVWLSSRGHCVGVLDNAPIGKFITEELCQEFLLDYRQGNIEIIGSGYGDSHVKLTGAYKFVLMTQVLTHLKWNPIHAVENIAAALRSEGTAIISVTDAEQYDYGEVPYTHWTDVPTVDSGEPALPAETICTYNEHTFEDLLRTTFSKVRITKPEGVQTLIAECRQ